MFTEKHPETGKNKLTTLAKSIIAGVSLVAAIAGFFFTIEDRYLNTAVAKEFMVKLEKDAVKTFQMQQKILETEQKGLTRKWDMERLRDLRDHKIMLRKELERDPGNDLIEERLEVIQQRIEKLENKLYQ